MRDKRGRFVKGHEGGPGRPKRATEQDYLAALSEAVGIDAWREVVARALEDAKAGDGKARDWLSKHLIGDATTDTPEADSDAAKMRERLALVGEYLLPLRLVDERFPVEEHARIAAQHLIPLAVANQRARDVDTAAG